MTLDTTSLGIKIAKPRLADFTNSRFIIVQAPVTSYHIFQEKLISHK